MVITNCQLSITKVRNVSKAERQRMAKDPLPCTHAGNTSERQVLTSAHDEQVTSNLEQVHHRVCTDHWNLLLLFSRCSRMMHVHHTEPSNYEIHLLNICETLQSFFPVPKQHLLVLWRPLSRSTSTGTAVHQPWIQGTQLKHSRSHQRRSNPGAV